MGRAHCFGMMTLLALCVVGLARAEAAEILGWQKEWPSPQQMLQGRDPAQVQQFLQWSAALAKNPGDVKTLDNRAYLDMEFARKGLYRSYWQWLAAKDLEAAVQINPSDFYAWHNYGDLNYNAGDLVDDERSFEREARGDGVHPRDRPQSEIGALLHGSPLGVFDYGRSGHVEAIGTCGRAAAVS